MSAPCEPDCGRIRPGGFAFVRRTHLTISAAALSWVLVCLPVHGQVTTIAHRGASGHAPEHTLAAYERALEMGADYIEQDLQMTSDGTLVVLHDDELDRTARGPAAYCTGRVIDRTLNEIRECEISSWWTSSVGGEPISGSPERIPTLDDVLVRFGERARFYIETKQPSEAPGMEQALLEALDRHGLRPTSRGDRRVLIQSFDPESLQTLAELDPGLPLVQLMGRLPDGDLDAAMARIAGYAIGVGPSRRLVDESFMAAAQRHGLIVHPYTVNSAQDMERLIDLGVDGMFTNWPDRLRALLTREP